MGEGAAASSAQPRQQTLCPLHAPPGSAAHVHATLTTRHEHDGWRSTLLRTPASPSQHKHSFRKQPSPAILLCSTHAHLHPHPPSHPPLVLLLLLLHACRGTAGCGSGGRATTAALGASFPTTLCRCALMHGPQGRGGGAWSSSSPPTLRMRVRKWPENVAQGKGTGMGEERKRGSASTTPVA